MYNVNENNMHIIDLHTHTNYSDGELTPQELMAAAAKIGCELIAVTDHDTVAGIKEAREAAKRYGIKFIAGIEISTQEHEEVHILGLGVDENNELLQTKCREFRECREKRAQLICDFFARRGIEILMDEIRRDAEGKVIARPHFARYLVKHGYVQSTKEAFERYLNTSDFHKEVIRVKPTPEEAIELIHQAGGKAVLAHPGQLKKNWEDREYFIASLKRAGLDGVECYYDKHTPADTEKFLVLARKFRLGTSCGSDYHGIHVKPDVQLGMYYDSKHCPDVELIGSTFMNE